MKNYLFATLFFAMMVIRMYKISIGDPAPASWFFIPLEVVFIAYYVAKIAVR